MLSIELLERIAVLAIPVVLAITLHEAAHGWAAWKLGDPTAKELGRLTANPVKHIDPIGTVVVPLVIVVGAWLAGIGPILFGWAKPVPVDLRRLGRPRRDMALVALAGPGSNLLMGLGWALVARAVVASHESLGALSGPIIYMAIAGIFANSIIFALNLLPVPPLDGGRVLVSALPPALGRIVARVEPFGLIIVVVAIVSGVLWTVMAPLMNFATSMMSVVAGKVPVQLL